jgi:tetratricopeptide (TPR) repeat protein
MAPEADEGLILLERLAQELPEEELLGLCSQLADRLLRNGWTAEAARWRTFSLVPSSLAERQEALDQARGCLRSRQSAAVLGALTSADLPSAWRDLLEQLRQHGRDPLPAALLREALVGDVPDEAVQLGMADLCLALDHDVAAELLLRRLVAQAGLAPTACNRLGVTAFRRGDPWQAERWFRTSLRQNVAQAVVWFELARVLRLQRQHDEALEAAEAGLVYAPAHPWGLKLRTRILLEVGGWRTLAVLADYDALPDDEELRQACLCTPLSRRRAWRRPLPPPPGLAQRLTLRQRLIAVGRIDVIQGRTLVPLRWARSHGLLPEGLPVQPWASRDPVAVREDLEAEGFQPLPERGLWSVADTPPDAMPTGEQRLVLLERPRDSVLPLSLQSFGLPESWIVQPVGLTAPGPERDPVLVSHGWELLPPLPDA